MTKLELMLKFETVTDELLQVDFAQSSSSIIDKVIDLLDQREIIIGKVDTLNSDEIIDNVVMNRILQKNIQVETLLEEVALSIKGKISEVVKEKSLSAKKKKAHRGYLNPGHQVDGYFIDKKK